jgi:4-cresol dehydrogenase (hydroxylating)
MLSRAKRPEQCCGANMTNPQTDHCIATIDDLQLALRDFGRVVGEQWVLSDAKQLQSYSDEYVCHPGATSQAFAAVLPASVQEIQALVRISSQRRVPLWPVSRGRNLGYGGASPRMPCSVVLDLQRLNRILEVDTRLGFCVIEPGVGFIDLFNYLRDNSIPLWVSAPGNPEGSVIGNALERGMGYTPYGEHATKLCGLEVVLPDGSLLRTGMGATNGGRAWHHYAAGLGPSWDQLFVQSNLGIVTRAGMWLMPEPEATFVTRVSLTRHEQLSPAIDATVELRLKSVVNHPVTFGSALHEAAVQTQRDEWYCGDGSIPSEIVHRVMSQYQLGWWNFPLMLFGYDRVIRAQAQIVDGLIERTLGIEPEWHEWHRGEPIERSAGGAPVKIGLNAARWYGAQGTHVCCAPVLPANGREAVNLARCFMNRYEQYGLDYCSSFTLGLRHITNVNTILFDQGNPAMIARAQALVGTLVADSTAAGYGEYRAHVHCMDAASDAFDFNGHALRRFNQLIKDAVDPTGILAPGKNGIWPAGYRGK